jgi:hypothetical protein
MDPSAAHLGQLLGNVRARIEPSSVDRVAAHVPRPGSRLAATSDDSIYAASAARIDADGAGADAAAATALAGAAAGGAP